ncbi:MAG TPA: EAL domain-containing protein [Stellaceae bacterium]|nr:EAL domain-containing protein [Stellaceae bacterium]
MQPPEPAKSPDLRSERDRFVAFAFAAADLLIEVSPEGRILFCAGAAQALTGKAPAGLLGTPVLELWLPGDRALMARMLRQASSGRVGPLLLHLGGTATRVSVSAYQLPGKTPGKIHLAIARALSGAEKAAAGKIDAATGLSDGKGFVSAALEALKSDSGTPSTELTLLRLEGLDGLHRRGGAAATSKFLGEMGAFLRQHAAAGGTAAGRLSPETCGILHPANSNVDFAAEVGALSRAADPARQGVTVGGHRVDMAAAQELELEDVAQTLAYTLESFTANADFNISSLAESLRDIARETLERHAGLKATVESERFSLAFQPIVSLADRQIHHYEVLARFHKQDGSPGDTIRFAEGVGLIQDFDLRVCRQAIDFLRERERHKSLSIAVNLSGHSLESAIFVSALQAMLADCPVELRARLLFEVTESTEIHRLEQVNAVLQDLRGRGHKVCLDDFGAGAASFSYLQALLVDFVKIDGAYVQRLLGNFRDRTIVKAMVQMCAELGISTIAEMIETKEQASSLSLLGVGYGQGYLYGKPQAEIASAMPTVRPAAASMKQLRTPIRYGASGTR